MATVECAGPETWGALPPDPWDVIRIADPGLAPEHEDGACENDLRVRVVMEKIDARPGPVVLAGRADRRLVEATVVLVYRLLGQRTSGSAPLA